jgi:hypothetical protein
MRNYLLFYTIFTAAVVGAAVYYCDKQAVEAIEKAEAMQKLNDRYAKFLHGEVNNRHTAMAMSVKVNPQYAPFFSHTLAPLNEYNEKVYGNNSERYIVLRNKFKTYWTDTLTADTAFLKYANLMILDKESEADWQRFFMNFKKYDAQEATQFLALDKLYWLQKINILARAIDDDFNHKRNEEEAAFRPNGVLFFSDFSKSCFSTKEEIQASVAMRSYLKTDSLVSFYINGQPIKSKNGKAYFDLPAGKASAKDKEIIASCAFNTKYYYSYKEKREIRYGVSK